MKRIFSLMLALSILFCLCACGNSSSGRNRDRDDSESSMDDNDSPSSNESQKIKHTGKKISGEITSASLFSDGLAFVCIDNDDQTTYCITKEGYIVYQIDNEFISTVNVQTYVGGLILINGKLYDTQGNVTNPEDLGVTQFYDFAFEGGYIIADIITADYSSTKKELCVFGKNLDVIIAPSEELYLAVEDSITRSSETYYYQDTVYFQQNDCFLNLKTGEISEDAPFEIPSSMWKVTSEGYIFDETVYLDVKKYENINSISGFNNGKATIEFYNKDAKLYFFSLIDEEGNLLFDPIQSSEKVAILTEYDGYDTIIVYPYKNCQNVKSYNTKGKLLGELDRTSSKETWIFDVGDGVIRVRYGSPYHTYYSYYNSDFTPLF